MTITLDEFGAQQLQTLRKTDAPDMVTMCREMGEDPATYFEDEDWSGLDLRGCDLTGVSFRGAVLDRVTVTTEQVAVVRITQPASMNDISIKPVPISPDRKDYRGADLRGKNFSGAKLNGADLRRANLYGAKLIEADLRRANLYGAKLIEADLIEADLRRANLRGANLRGANLRGADLELADCNRMRIDSARLQSASLKHARNLTQGQIDSAFGSSETILPEGLVRPAHWED